MKIAIGSDHAGYELKTFLINEMKDFVFLDVGTFSEESVDYPDYAHQLSSKVINKETEFGILICGSGQGVCMTANKHKEIRASLAWNIEVAKLSRQHNNANVICIPARFIDKENAIEIIYAFLKESFKGGRHERRVNKI